jgi:hypothetical protein
MIFIFWFKISVPELQIFQMVSAWENCHAGVLINGRSRQISVKYRIRLVVHVLHLMTPRIGFQCDE